MKINHRIGPIFFAILLCLAFAPAFAQSSRVDQGPQFFQALNDVPLMPGLYEIFEESVIFDKPEGRIIESAAASEDLEFLAIRQYYRQTLPQLGWSPVAEDTFVRQGESLRFKIERQDGYNIIRFTVEPR